MIVYLNTEKLLVYLFLVIQNWNISKSNFYLLNLNIIDVPESSSSTLHSYNDLCFLKWSWKLQWPLKGRICAKQPPTPFKRKAKGNFRKKSKVRIQLASTGVFSFDCQMNRKAGLECLVCPLLLTAAWWVMQRGAVYSHLMHVGRVHLGVGGKDVRDRKVKHPDYINACSAV